MASPFFVDSSEFLLPCRLTSMKGINPTAPQGAASEDWGEVAFDNFPTLLEGSGLEFSGAGSGWVLKVGISVSGYARA